MIHGCIGTCRLAKYGHLFGLHKLHEFAVLHFWLVSFLPPTLCTNLLWILATRIDSMKPGSCLHRKGEHCFEPTEGLQPKKNIQGINFSIRNWLYLITLTHVARYVIVAQGKETKGAKSVVDSYHDYSLIHEVKRTKTVRSSISRHISSLNRDNNEFEMLSSWNIIWGHRGKNNSYIGAKATNTSTPDFIVIVSLSLNHFIAMKFILDL